MDKTKNKDTTGTVISIIISLTVIIAFAGTFISNQAKIDTQLINIQAQVAEINVKLDKRDEEIKKLTERLTIVETELKNR